MAEALFGRPVRLNSSSGVMIVPGTVIAPLVSYQNFFTNIENFLGVLLFLFVPGAR